MEHTPLRSDLDLEQENGLEPARSLLHPRQGATVGAEHTAQQRQWSQVLDSSPTNISPVMVRTAAREMLETAIYILLVFVIVRSLVQNFKIEGSSMEPNLHSEQYILVNKLVYFHFDLHAPLRLLPGYDDLSPRVVYPFRLPERGDVLVFEFPGNVQKDYIKRVIALPGETIAFRNGNVYVNDILLQEQYLDGAPTFCDSGVACNISEYVVPEGSLFVMGDNRANSSDSRAWGALPLERVIGQAWLLYYPIDNWGTIPDVSYAADEQRE